MIFKRIRSGRFTSLMRCDILFQIRYGFYWLYAFFIVFYAALLTVFPEKYQQRIASLLIFTDPAAMGLFFMGAIVLFEKSQRVIESIATSPVRISEYILSKAVSISIVSVISALFIAFSLYLNRVQFFHTIQHFILFIASLCLSSFMFTFCALGCASVCRTLNQFMIYTIPFELFLMVPSALFMFGIRLPILEFHPGILALRIIMNENEFPLPAVFVLLAAWISASYMFASASVKKMMMDWGGMKL